MAKAKKSSDEPKQIPPYKLLRNDTVDYFETQYRQSFEKSDQESIPSLKLLEPKTSPRDFLIQMEQFLKSIERERINPDAISSEIIASAKTLALEIVKLKQELSIYADKASELITKLNQHIQSLNETIGMINASQGSKTDAEKAKNQVQLAWQLQEHSFFTFEQALDFIHLDQIPVVNYPIPASTSFPEVVKPFTKDTIDVIFLQNSLEDAINLDFQISMPEIHLLAKEMIHRFLQDAPWGSLQELHRSLESAVHFFIPYFDIHRQLLKIQLDALALAKQYLKQSALTFIQSNSTSLTESLVSERIATPCKIERTSVHQLARSEFIAKGVDWDSLKEIMVDQYMNLIPSSPELALEFVNKVLTHELTRGPISNLMTFVAGLQTTWEALDPQARGAIIWTFFREHGLPAKELNLSLLALALAELNLSKEELTAARDNLILDYQTRNQKSQQEAQSDVDDLLLLTVWYGPYESCLDFIHTFRQLARIKLPKTDDAILRVFFNKMSLPFDLVGTAPLCFVRREDLPIDPSVLKKYRPISVSAIDKVALEESLRQLLIPRDHGLIPKIIITFFEKGPFASLGEIKISLIQALRENRFDDQSARKHAEAVYISLNADVLAEQLLKIPSRELFSEQRSLIANLLAQASQDFQDLVSISKGLIGTTLPHLAKAEMRSVGKDLDTPLLEIAYSEVTSRAISMRSLRKEMLKKSIENGLTEEEAMRWIDDALYKTLEESPYSSAELALLNLQFFCYRSKPNINLQPLFEPLTKLALPASNKTSDRVIDAALLNVFRQRSEAYHQQRLAAKGTIDLLNQQSQLLELSLSPYFEPVPESTSTSSMTKIPLIQVDATLLSLLAKNLHLLLAAKMPTLLSDRPFVIVPAVWKDESDLMPLLLNIDPVFFQKIFAASTFHRLYGEFGTPFSPMLELQLQLFLLKLLNDSHLYAILEVVSTLGQKILRFAEGSRVIDLLLSQTFLNVIRTHINSGRLEQALQQILAQDKENKTLSADQTQKLVDLSSVLLLYQAISSLSSSLQAPGLLWHIVIKAIDLSSQEISNFLKFLSSQEIQMPSPLPQDVENPIFIVDKQVLSPMHLAESLTTLVMHLLKKEVDNEQSRKIADQLTVDLVSLNDDSSCLMLLKKAHLKDLSSMQDILLEYLYPSCQHQELNQRSTKTSEVFLDSLRMAYSHAKEAPSSTFDYLG